MVFPIGEYEKNLRSDLKNPLILSIVSFWFSFSVTIKLHSNLRQEEVGFRSRVEVFFALSWR